MKIHLQVSMTKTKCGRDIKVSMLGCRPTCLVCKGESKKLSMEERRLIMIKEIKRQELKAQQDRNYGKRIKLY